MAGCRTVLPAGTATAQPFQAKALSLALRPDSLARRSIRRAERSHGEMFIERRARVKNVKRTPEPQCAVCDTSAYLGHVYRATCNPRRWRRLRVARRWGGELTPTSGACTESGPPPANQESDPCILQGGQSKASPGSRDAVGTARNHPPTPYDSYAKSLDWRRPQGSSPSAGNVGGHRFCAAAMPVADTPIPSDWPKRSTSILSAWAKSYGLPLRTCESRKGDAARQPYAGRFCHGHGP